MGEQAHGSVFEPSNEANRLIAILVGVVVFLTPTMLFGLVALSVPPTPRHPLADIAAGLGVEARDLVIGEIVYRNNCALCHGRSAEGVPHLGKPLRNSEFVQKHSDEELFEVIARGRMPGDPENTTGVAMPARGNTSAPDDDLWSVIAHLRMIQDPSQPFAALDDWSKPDSGGSLVSGPAGIGHDAFVASCSACHGTEGEGREGLGKALRGSDFVASQTEEELIKFVKSGRPSWDEANTTGLDMPPKGGNPALSDEQLKQIVAYIRALHDSESGP